MSWLRNAPGRQTFSASVNERFESTLHVFSVNHVDQRRVHPSPRLYRIESTNDDLELKVKVFILILDCTMMAYMESAITEVRRYAVTITPLTLFMTKFAAVVAFGWPTSEALGVSSGKNAKATETGTVD
jgi:hypothetical protein